MPRRRASLTAPGQRRKERRAPVLSARVFVVARDAREARARLDRYVETAIRPECVGSAVHVSEQGEYHKIAGHYEHGITIPIVDARQAPELLARLIARGGSGWSGTICARNAGGAPAGEGIHWIHWSVVDPG